VVATTRAQEIGISGRQGYRQRIGPLGFPQFLLGLEDQISDRLACGWEIFYDDDGKYLRYVTSPSEQLFFVKR